MKFPSFAAAAALLLGMGSAHAADPAPANGWVVSAYTLPPAGVAQPTHDAGIIAEGIFLAPGEAASGALLKPYIGFEPGNMLAWHLETAYAVDEKTAGPQKLKVTIGHKDHPSVQQNYATGYKLDCSISAQIEGHEVISEVRTLIDRRDSAKLVREAEFAIDEPDFYDVDVWVACDATENPQLAALQTTVQVDLASDDGSTQGLTAEGVKASPGGLVVIAKKKEVSTDGLPVRPGLLLTPATGVVSRGDIEEVTKRPIDLAPGDVITPARLANDPSIEWPEVRSSSDLLRGYVIETLVRAERPGKHTVAVVLQPDNRDASLRDIRDNRNAVHILRDGAVLASSELTIPERHYSSSNHPVIAAANLDIDKPGYYPVKISIDAAHLINFSGPQDFSFSHGDFAYSLMFRSPADVAIQASKLPFFVQCHEEEARCLKAQPEAETPAVQPEAAMNEAAAPSPTSQQP